LAISSVSSAAVLEFDVSSLLDTGFVDDCRCTVIGLIDDFGFDRRDSGCMVGTPLDIILGIILGRRDRCKEVYAPLFVGTRLGAVEGLIVGVMDGATDNDADGSCVGTIDRVSRS
jgi:hypothetical protein